MRLRVLLENPRETAVPLNHQDLLTGLVYRLLETSNADYSHFLHDQGYGLEDDRHRFKLFVFSNLRSHRRPRYDTERLYLPAGYVEWFLASPVEEFLTHAATALLTAGQLRVGSAGFPIGTVETLPAPDFSPGKIRCICLSAIVASVPRPPQEGKYPRYLRPADGEEFSRVVNSNLAHKHQVLYGRPPEGDPVHIQFDQGYLEKHRGGTKLIHYKGIQIVGAMAPLTATGDPALLQVGYECGFGEKNAGGFGMVEEVRNPAREEK